MANSPFRKVEIVKAYEGAALPGRDRKYCARLYTYDNRYFPVFSRSSDRLAQKVKEAARGPLPLDIPANTIGETKEMDSRVYSGDLPVTDTERMLFSFHITRDIKQPNASVEDRVSIRVGAAALA